jgi:type IV secretory pathway VirB10-like protein
MKKRTAAAAILIVALGLIAWEFFPQSQADNKSAPPAAASSKATTADTKVATVQNYPKAADQETPDQNQRTRPSQPPVEKVYPKPKHPEAERVPGKQGYVFSPFNNKLIDVREIPPGTLVADPTSSPEEERYFRVPK